MHVYKLHVHVQVPFIKFCQTEAYSVSLCSHSASLKFAERKQGVHVQFRHYVSFSHFIKLRNLFSLLCTQAIEDYQYLDIMDKSTILKTKDGQP